MSQATADQTELNAALVAVVGAAHVRAAGPDHGAGLLVLPASTAEVASLVALCARRDISLVPQGGQTGLVGGCQSQPGQVVLSLTRMAQIEAIYPSERVAVVQAGVAVEALQAATAAYGLEPGIDLAAGVRPQSAALCPPMRAASWRIAMA